MTWQIVGMGKCAALVALGSTLVGGSSASTTEHALAAPAPYASTPAEGPVFCHGLPHTGLGAAIVECLEGGELLVSNIGSSGMDGVFIDLGAADSHILQIDTPPAEMLPDGANLRIASRGVVNKQGNQVIWIAQVTDIGDRFGLSLDTSVVDPDVLRVEVYRDGVLQRVDVYDPPPDDETILGRFPPTSCRIDPLWQMYPLELDFILEFQEETPIEMRDGNVEIVDTVVLAALNPTADVGTLSRTVFRGTDIRTLTIEEELLGKFHLGHRAIGDTLMTTGPEGLFLTNIGSSGQDGVAIDVDESVEWRGVIPPPTTGMGVGETFVATAFGTIDGITDQRLATIMVERPDTENGLLTADFPVTSGGLVVEFWLDDELVDEQKSQQQEDIRIFWPWAIWRLFFDDDETEIDNLINFRTIESDGSLSEEETAAPFGHEAGDPQDVRGQVVAVCNWEIAPETAPPVTFTWGENEYVANRIRIRTIPAEDAADVWATTAIELLPFPSPLLISDETNEGGVMFSRLPCIPLGRANLRREADVLRVNNIGPSGADGVGIRLGRLVGGLDVALEPVVLSEPGRALLLAARGTVGGEPDRLVGTAGVRNRQGVLELEADFSVIGVDLVRVEVYRDGVFVGSDIVEGGTLGVFQDDSIEVAEVGKLPIDPRRVCWISETVRDFELETLNGVLLAGDEFRVLINNSIGPGALIENYSLFAIRGERLGQLTLLDIEVLAVCEGDVDGNRVVDFADILSILAEWGPYEPCPPFKPQDLDQNCAVDFADILVVLSGWGDCP